MSNTNDNTTSSFLGGFLHEDEDEAVVKRAPRVNALDADLYSDRDYDAANQIAVTTQPQSKFAEIDRLVDSNIRALLERYPQGGLKSSRVVTSTILKEAPAEYFDRFIEDIQEGTEFVQILLTDRGGSEIVARSQKNPTDEAIQDAAYTLVKAMILEFLGKKAWSNRDRLIISQLISNEIIGFSAIDPLWRDRTINEIAVDGPFSIKVEIAGKWTYVRSCKFRSQAHLEQLLERLYDAVGKSPSRMEPRLKGRLHDNSRLYTVHKSLMPMGPSLNIRRHSEHHWAPVDLVNRGSASA